MTLGERFQAILDELPSGWTEAQVVVTVPAGPATTRAAVILASLQPGRAGSSFRLRVASSGLGGPSLDATRRVLERLEREDIDARLSVPEHGTEVAPPSPSLPPVGLAETWDSLSSSFPTDWCDAYLEVELVSSEDVERAALLLAPVNPFLVDGKDGRPTLRFRCAHRFGYGAAPTMARRVLARLDEEPIAGTLRLLRLQADAHPVLTQGLVWREAGRAV